MAWMSVITGFGMVVRKDDPRTPQETARDGLQFTKMRRKAPTFRSGDIRRNGQGARCPAGRSRLRFSENGGIL